MYVYICIHIYVYIHTCMRELRQALMHIDTHKLMYTEMLIDAPKACVCAHARTRACVHVHVHVHMHVCV